MFLLDTASIEAIQSALSIFPIAGVTTNPSILAKEGVLPISPHLQAIKEMIGPDRSLHVQVLSVDTKEILREAGRITEQLGKDVYIKVPVTPQGLAAISLLKQEGFLVTATAIYTSMQGYLAIAAGADYIAPYYNRMENLGLDAAEQIQALAHVIQQMGASTKILGASYKNVAQIEQTFLAGGHCVTANPDVLTMALISAPVEQAVAQFTRDWESVYGAGVTM